MSTSEITTLVIAAAALLLGVFNFRHQRKTVERSFILKILHNDIDALYRKIEREEDYPFILQVINNGSRETRVSSVVIFYRRGSYSELDYLIPSDFFGVIEPSGDKQWKPSKADLDWLGSGEPEDPYAPMGFAVTDIDGKTECIHIERWGDDVYHFDRRQRFKIWRHGLRLHTLSNFDRALGRYKVMDQLAHEQLRSILDKRHRRSDPYRV